MTNLENVFVDQFPIQYAYPSWLIIEHLSNMLDDDWITNLKAMVIIWISAHDPSSLQHQRPPTPMTFNKFTLSPYAK